MIFAFCTGDSLGSAALDADITKYTYGKAVNRGYSTIQVARMLGVDEQTLLSLLEVSCRPRVGGGTDSGNRCRADCRAKIPFSLFLWCNHSNEREDSDLYQLR